MPAPGQTLKPMIRLPKDPADCWTYLGPKTPDGYGKKRYCGHDISAPRWLWMTLFGPLPDDLAVSHTCGHPGCMNPHHLRACSQADANRAGIGATLTPADVLDIKRAKKGRTIGTAALLAERYGVSRRLIFDIWGKRAWSKAGLRSKARAT